MRMNKGLGWAALSSLPIIVSCATGQDGTGAVAHSRQAVVLANNSSCPIGEPCSISARYPSGVPDGLMAVVATHGVMVGGSAELRGTSGALGFAATEAGRAEIQAQGRVGGVWSGESAFVGSQALVEGKVLSAETPTIQSGAVVGGVGTAQGTPAKATFRVTFPGGSFEDQTLTNNAARDIPPGRYGELHVFSGSTARLTTGLYYFEQLKVEPGGQVIVNNEAGTAVLWVRGEVMSRGTWQSTGNPSDILIGSFYQGTIDLGGEFDATLLAPEAAVYIGPGPSPTVVHNGLFWGRTVEVRSGVKVEAVNVTRSGDAFTGLDGEWEGADGVTPPDLPDPNTMSWDEYQAALADYYNELVASGYRGPTVEVPAHPEAATADDLTSFNKPVPLHGDDSITQEDAPEPEARPGFPIGEPLPNPADPLDLPHVSATLDVLEDQVDQATAQVTAQLPHIDPASPEVGRPIKAAPEFPRECRLSDANIDTGATTADLKQQLGQQGFYRELSYGERPSWINPNVYPTDPARIQGNVPRFDAYFFIEGYLHSFIADDRGLFGEVDGQFGLGGAIMHSPVRIVDVRVHAETNAWDRRFGRNGPHVEAGVSAVAINTEVMDKRLETGIDVQPIKQTLIDGRFRLLPVPIDFYVGPFNIEINGGVEANVPLVLDVSPMGPELTLAPMARAFITVFGGVDAGIKVGLEGEADLLRVDAPLSAKLRWHNRLTPEECGMSADFRATLGLDFTTLNGTLYAVAGISDSLIPGLLWRQEIVSWEGIHLFSTEIDLFDASFPDVLKYPQDWCQLGAETCYEGDNAADEVVSSFPATHSGFVTVDATDYGDANCPGLYLVDVPLDGTLPGVYVQALWAQSDVTSADECNDSHARVYAWKEYSDGHWEVQPVANFRGEWITGANCVRMSDDASLPNGEVQLFDQPWTYFTTESNVTALRLGIASEVGCYAKQLRVKVADHR